MVVLAAVALAPAALEMEILPQPLHHKEATAAQGRLLLLTMEPVAVVARLLLVRTEHQQLLVMAEQVQPHLFLAVP